MLRKDGRRFGHGSPIALAALAVGALVAAGGSGKAVAGSKGECITLHVEAPIKLPDGGVYPPGALTLCDSVRVSPVSSIHKTYVNGHPVAMLASRKTRSEGGSTLSPVAVFRRDGKGRLELFGYVLPGKGKERSVTYILTDKIDELAPPSGVAVASAPEAEAAPETGTLLVVAARTP